MNNFIIFRALLHGNIINDLNKNNITYPVSNVGGLSNIYEKVINVIQKSKYQSKLMLSYIIKLNY
jgi:hypothetical protein